MSGTDHDASRLARRNLIFHGRIVFVHPFPATITPIVPCLRLYETIGQTWQHCITCTTFSRVQHCRCYIGLDSNILQDSKV